MFSFSCLCVCECEGDTMHASMCVRVCSRACLCVQWMRACMCMRWFMFENCIRNVIKIAAIRFDAMRCDSPQVQVQFECGRVEEEGGGAEGHSTPIHTRQFTRFIPLSLALLSFRLPVRSQCRCLCVCARVCVFYLLFTCADKMPPGIGIRGALLCLPTISSVSTSHFDSCTR